MLSLEQFAERLDALAEISSVEIFIAVADAKAARYARALEFGSVSGEKPWPAPGPRTVTAVNPDTGEQVVVSAQAPQGFVRVRAAEFRSALVDEMLRAADWLDAAALNAHLADALRRSAAAALDELRRAAPRNSGRFAASLALVEP
jgi:hypothetical protein